MSMAEVLDAPGEEKQAVLEVAASRLASAEFVFRRLLSFSEETDSGYIAAGYDPEALAARQSDLRAAIALTETLIREFVGPKESRPDLN